MSDIWEIVPYVGIGPLRFGMTPADVQELRVLPAVKREIEEYGEFQENRGVGQPLLRYVDNSLIEIVCDEPSEHQYTFNGVWVFDPDSRMVVLMATRGVEIVQYEQSHFLLMNQGISFWNYIDEIEDGAIRYGNMEETGDRRMVVLNTRTVLLDYEPTTVLRRDQL